MTGCVEFDPFSQNLYIYYFYFLYKVPRKTHQLITTRHKGDEIMKSWISIKIDSEDDRSAVVAILARNEYEIRVTKRKVGNRYERYVEYREREEENHLP